MPENNPNKASFTMLPVVNFTMTLRALQVREREALGLAPPDTSQNINLPDGKEDIFHRLWERISSKRFGNQIFNNDSIYRYVFPSINGEPLSEDEQVLYDYCKEAVVENTIFFDVSW
jgi:hypothetical protein